MKFHYAFSVLIIMAFIFQIQSIHPTLAQQDTGYPKVVLGPGFQENQITYAYKFYNASQQTNFTSVIGEWGSTFNSTGTPNISGGITSSIFPQTQVLTIFGASVQSTQTEINVVRTGITQGKGILYLVGNSSTSAQNFFDSLFYEPVVNFTANELQGSTYSGSLPYVTATDISSPTTPITANVTKLIFPHTFGITINSTAVSETNMTIKDIYPVISYNNYSLGVAIEVGDFGRILILGSSQIFSNDFFGTTGPYSKLQGVDNSKFSKSVIDWLGRADGYFNMFDYSLNVVPKQTVNRGIIINGTAQMTTDNNKTFDDTIVRFELTIPNTILDYNYMTYIGNNTYTGSIATRKVTPGYWVEIHVELVRRGYIQQSFILGRVYFALEFMGPSLPNISLIVVLFAGILIFIITSAYVWLEFRKDVI